MKISTKKSYVVARHRTYEFLNDQKARVASFNDRKEEILSPRTPSQKTQHALLDECVVGLAAYADHLIGKDLHGPDCEFSTFAYVRIVAKVQTSGREKIVSSRPISMDKVIAHMQNHNHMFADQRRAIAQAFPEILRSSATDRAVHGKKPEAALAAA